MTALHGRSSRYANPWSWTVALILGSVVLGCGHHRSSQTSTSTTPTGATDGSSSLTKDSEDDNDDVEDGEDPSKESQDPHDTSDWTDTLDRPDGWFPDSHGEGAKPNLEKILPDVKVNEIHVEIASETWAKMQ